MRIPQKLLVPLLMLTALLSGIAVATCDLIRVNQAVSLGGSIGSAFGQVQKMTVSVKLLFGLIPVGSTEHPYLVTAVGDVVLGTLAASFAMLLVYVLIVAFRRTPPDSSDDKSHSAQP